MEPSGMKPIVERLSDKLLEEKINLPSISNGMIQRTKSAGNAWVSDNPALRQLSTKSYRARRPIFPRGHWQKHAQGLSTIQATSLPAIGNPVNPQASRIKDKNPELVRAKTETSFSAPKKVRFFPEATCEEMTWSSDKDGQTTPSVPSSEQMSTTHRVSLVPVEDASLNEDETGAVLGSAEKEGLENIIHKSENALGPFHKTETRNEETENYALSMMDILRGNFSKLPPPKTNTVRIFLSSTFSDMKEERTVLFRKSFPDLQEFCKSLRLEFQVVDMRWGVSEHIISDHGVTATCKQQIKLCKRNSVGPNFAVIFGDRYGFQPLPVTIPADEMKILTNICDTCEIPNADLLPEWYILDQNANPNVYEIQPVRKKIKHYLEYGDPIAQKKATTLWNVTQEQLQLAINETLHLAQRKGLMTLAQIDKYLSSVTEDEVNAGIMHNTKPNAIAFHRKLTGVTSYDDEMSHKFFDVVDKDAHKTYDASKRERLERLKETTKDKIGLDYCYEAKWMKKGLELDTCLQNASYLERFCDDFTESMKKKITKSLRDTQDKGLNPLHDEVLHHAWFCVDRRNRFIGQEDVLTQVKNYMTNENQNSKPLVIHGPSGCGKTSLMSKLVGELTKWLGHSTVTMVRFLGTSPDSSNIRSNLLSYIKQICQVYGSKLPEKEDIGTPVKLGKYFSDLLNQCSSMDTGKLVLLFDSLDQLNLDEIDSTFQWIPVKCPKDVHIICSIASNVGSMSFKDLKERFRSENQFIEIRPMSVQNMTSVLECNLSKQKRNVTPEQMTKLIRAGEKCCWPLYLTIIAKEALQWKSYDPVDSLRVEPTIHSAINKIFHNLETKYNSLFVSTALGYITVSSGLSEVELEDALSMNDGVLDSVYEFHNPPMEGVIRVPPLLWARVRHDIDDYLVERDADGATVLCWYHRQFWEAAGQRYLKLNGSSSVNLNCEYSSHLADLFLVETPLRRTIHLTRRNYTIENADRLVNLQPAHPTSTRKLTKLPSLLAQSGSTQSQKYLKEKVLCNIRWIMAKIQGISFQSTLKDYELAGDNDPEIRFIYDTLKLAAPVLEKEPSKLPLELISRLPSAISKWAQLQKMVAESNDILHAGKGILLRPLYPCLPIPDGNLLATHKGPTHIIGFIDATSCICWGKEKGLELWNLGSYRILRHLSQPQYANDICTSLDRKMIFHTEETRLVVWNAESGSMILRLDLLPTVSNSGRKHQPSKEFPFLTTMCVSDDGRMIAVRINHSEMKVEDHGLLIVDCQYHKVVLTLAAGVHGDRIPSVRFIGKTCLYYACVKQVPNSASKETCLVKYDISSKEQSQLTLNKKLTVKGRFEGSTTQSSLLITNNRNIIVACRPDDFIVIEVDTWTLCFMTSQDKSKGALIACQTLNNSEIICMSYDAKARGTILTIYDADYNIVTQMKKYGIPRNGGQVVADRPTVLHTSEPHALAFVGYDFSGSIEIWDCRLTKLVYTLNAHSQSITGIWFEPNRRTLHTSSLDQTIKQWNANSLIPHIFHTKQGDNEAKGSRQDCDNMINDGANGECNISCDVGGLRLIQAIDLGLQDIQEATTGVFDLVSTRKGDILFTCYEDGLPRTWNPLTGHCLHKVKSPHSIGGVPTMSPGYEDDLFVCQVKEEIVPETEGETGFSIKIWNKSTGEFLDLMGKPIPVLYYGLSRNGRFIAIISQLPKSTIHEGTNLSVLDLVSGKKLFTTEGLGCTFLAVSDDGMRVLVIAHRTNLTIIENTQPGGAKANRTTRKFNLPINTTLNAIAFLNKDRVIIGTTYGSIVDIDLNKLELISRSTKCQTIIPEKHAREIAFLAVSSDEQFLVSASTDRTLKVVDIPRKKQIGQLEGHSDRVMCVDISADNKFIVSGSRDKTIRLWNLKDGVQVYCFDAYSDVFKIRFCGEHSRSIAAVTGRFDLQKLMMFCVQGEKRTD